MFLRYFFLLVFSLGLTHSNSQEKKCGAVEAIEKSLSKNPEKRQILDKLESYTKEFIENKRMCRGVILITLFQQLFTLFIIMEVSEFQNQVLSCIESINNDFNALNDDISGVISEFSSIISDMGIEFRLAKLDPEGNCTDGITYHQSILTYEGGENVKDDTFWNNDMYLNIWVVADLASQGTAAYAYYPGTAPNNHEGIICDDDYFGTIGTASNSNWSVTQCHMRLGIILI